MLSADWPIGRRSPRAARVTRRVVGPLVRLLFRPTLTGVEHLPTEGPYLLVANHSAGLGLAELASFAVLFLAQVDRPLAGFAHPVGFRFWPFHQLHRALGSVPSTYEDAREALARGVPLLVFPGGDHETLRPIWQAGRVDFGGRRGFIRVAQAAGVPIVPMGIRGSHYTVPMLVRARALAWLLVLPRALGVKRWGLSLAGVLGAAALLALGLPWGVKAPLAFLWLALPFQFFCLIPWTIRLRIGPPLTGFDQIEDEDGVAAARDRVQAAVQALVSAP
ncbi:MAG: 1-acyl-sn-glycerol-3-phosphate acyltransferase [Myxococcales bacterium]|nr:1-acyl-sn-glycerol-3-phosphate acyltransferase [Myxococcales bacterium]